VENDDSCERKSNDWRSDRRVTTGLKRAAMTAVIIIKGFIAFVICVAVLVTNIPVIVMSRSSDRLKDDVVSKVMASLCVIDIAAGCLPSVVSAVVAWLQPDSVPTALCAFQVRALP